LKRKRIRYCKTAATKRPQLQNGEASNIAMFVTLKRCCSCCSIKTQKVGQLAEVKLDRNTKAGTRIISNYSTGLSNKKQLS